MTARAARSVLKRCLIALGAVFVVAGLGVGIYVAVQVAAYERSMSRVYDVPLPTLARSSDSAVLARGKHLVESVGACAAHTCHGSDLGGGDPIEMGPVGVFAGRNLTTLEGDYSDGEIARLLRHGLKKDGRSVRFMPVQDIAWLPDDDIAAIISYLRTVARIEKSTRSSAVGVLGKVLDRRGATVIDVARRIDHVSGERGGSPEPTAAYGRLLAANCTGCHGGHLSGGRIPGAPASLPIPSNLTPDETGLRGWSYEDFDGMLTTGIRKNGKKLDPFMPVDTFSKLDKVERTALWAYLQSVPPTPFGER